MEAIAGNAETRSAPERVFGFFHIAEVATEMQETARSVSGIRRARVGELAGIEGEWFLPHAFSSGNRISNSAPPSGTLSAETVHHAAQIARTMDRPRPLPPGVVARDDGSPAAGEACVRDDRLCRSDRRRVAGALPVCRNRCRVLQCERSSPAVRRSVESPTARLVADGVGGNVLENLLQAVVVASDVKFIGGHARDHAQPAVMDLPVVSIQHATKELGDPYLLRSSSPATFQACGIEQISMIVSSL